MAERRPVDVEFDYEVTDPKVVEEAVRKILAEVTSKVTFQVDGWRSHEDRAGGYFRVHVIES